jgi:hypothetical protein
MAKRARTSRRRHREDIFRRGGVGGIFDDLADDRCHPHVVEEVERECICVKALANPEVLIFLNRIYNATAPRLDPRRVTDGCLRLS